MEDEARKRAMQEKVKVFVQSAVLRCHEEYDPEHAKHIHGNLCACIACINAVATRLVEEARAEERTKLDELRRADLSIYKENAEEADRLIVTCRGLRARAEAADRRCAAKDAEIKRLRGLLGQAMGGSGGLSGAKGE